MATTILNEVPGAVTTILDMNPGQVAGILAILGPPECHCGMPTGIVPGITVRCIGHDEDATTLEGPDGLLLRIPRDLAGCIQIERVYRPRPRSGRTRAR
ncbi:MAG TPA: hypothetical protein VNZ57_09885 [Longimicrobiales bacterium]|nr:hypothetical protein [Longimicrobiales bacterium]